MIKDFTFFNEPKVDQNNIIGYIILGDRHNKYFHIYDDRKENKLFEVNTSTSYNVISDNTSFIIFQSKEDAINDMKTLRNACYNDDYGLDMYVCKCIIPTGTYYQEGKFCGYKAFNCNSLIVDITDKTLNHID